MVRSYIYFQISTNFKCSNIGKYELCTFLKTTFSKNSYCGKMSIVNIDLFLTATVAVGGNLTINIHPILVNLIQGNFFFKYYTYNILKIIVFLIRC